MKTVRSHLNDLKEPERTSALKAMDESAWGHEYQRHPKLADALYVAFDWGKAFHGNAYWERIFDNLEAETYFDTTPQKITVEVKEFTAPELTERIATDEDYEKLEDVVRSIKATVILEAAAPATEPNFGTKDTNPKDSLGIKKVPLSGMPAPVLLECGLVKLHGDLKYGRYNWRDAGVRGSVYYDASMRHMMAWYEGEDLDPDSEINHIAHAIAGLMVLRDSMIQGNWTDDRPKPTKVGWLAEMNEIAKNMIEKHENDR